MTYGIINTSAGDPTPAGDPTARREFVARVASLQVDILKPKLQHMITNLQEIFEHHENHRDTDLVIKGAIYALRELIKWGDVMVNEHIADRNNVAQKAHELNDNE